MFNVWNDDRRSVVEWTRDGYRQIQGDQCHSSDGLKKYLDKLVELENEIMINGYFEAETTFNRFKLTHLHTWFESNEAMVMFLSNNTIQVAIWKKIYPDHSFISSIKMEENANESWYIDILPES